MTHQGRPLGSTLLMVTVTGKPRNVAEDDPFVGAALLDFQVLVLTRTTAFSVDPNESSSAS